MGLNDPVGFDFGMRNVRIKRGHALLCLAQNTDGGWAEPEKSCQNNMRHILGPIYTCFSDVLSQVERITSSQVRTPDKIGPGSKISIM